MRFLFGRLQHETSRCCLAHTRGAIKQQMLRIRRTQLGHQGFHSARLTDDFGGGPRAAPGTPDAAKINCMDRIHWRSGGSARLVQVIEMENGMTIVKAAGLFGLRYVCFADPDGEVVRVRRDQGFGLF